MKSIFLFTVPSRRFVRIIRLWVASSFVHVFTLAFTLVFFAFPVSLSVLFVVCMA